MCMSYLTIGRIGILEPTRALICITLCLSVWVCGSYVVHHLNGTGLRCAPPTCVVHHSAQG